MHAVIMQKQVRVINLTPTNLNNPEPQIVICGVTKFRIEQEKREFVLN